MKLSTNKSLRLIRVQSSAPIWTFILIKARRTDPYQGDLDKPNYS